ncbi:cytochrome b5 [Polychaeton citri CBS 116435]|uniref:Cytochrome b5 n=1 Tax=Polychaeton citri CBS 116435 TaxID=1314669 RepID=A0A9P4USV6_9PEZI|nr:cytochrome b5 [Polychaeton citri CBS 116435]
MSEVRQRKPDTASNASQPAGKAALSTGKKSNPPIILLLAPVLFFVGVVGYIIYISNFVTDFSSLLHQVTGGKAGTAVNGRVFTDEQLLPYDGTDPAKPIYLAIKGTVFDVSASPKFYGPGGHYHHFVGRDASRAWVTECWDDPAQLIPDMDGLHQVFMPKYLDEDLQNAADGKISEDDAASGALPIEQLKDKAAQVIQKFGRTSKKEIARRQEADRPEAEERVEEAIAHWYNFFDGNPKYTKVGTVVRDPSVTREAPPPLCEKARKKRPIKGGKLEAILNAAGNVGGQGAGQAGAAEGKPAFVNP